MIYSFVPLSETMNKGLIFQIAINNLKGMGVIQARQILSYLGGLDEAFRNPPRRLKDIPKYGPALAWALQSKNTLYQAEKEMNFMEKHGIKSLFLEDDQYPERLRECPDGPLIIFLKGSLNLNNIRMLAIVGSRKMSHYGRGVCERLVEKLRPFHPVIVSGLAYGVDATAHRGALTNHLPTAAVLGHGLDRIYPSSHATLAREIVQEGGALITEHLSGDLVIPGNFPKRNRIIAGLCDAVVVVEAANTGGALITAKIANSYNREVFALPGRTTDPFSQGCNRLIRTNLAHLMEDADNLTYVMNWIKTTVDNPTARGTQIDFLDPEEQAIASILGGREDTDMDTIARGTGLDFAKIASLLLGLELKGIIDSLPGNKYRLLHR